MISAVRYNPRAQRELVTHGNGVTIQYDYDKKTFRLIKLQSTPRAGRTNGEAAGPALYLRPGGQYPVGRRPK
jgi:hypothetical protein